MKTFLCSRCGGDGGVRGGCLRCGGTGIEPQEVESTQWCGTYALNKIFAQMEEEQNADQPSNVSEG